jgi:hypothetical protein
MLSSEVAMLRAGRHGSPWRAFNGRQSAVPRHVGSTFMHNKNWLAVRCENLIIFDVIGSCAALHLIPPAAVFAELASPGWRCIDVLALLVISWLSGRVINPAGRHLVPFPS